MIVAVAVLPFDVFAVIVAVPEPTAVTVPSDTAATLSLLVLHVTLLSVALEGVTVAVSLPVSPVESLSEEGETDTSHRQEPSALESHLSVVSTVCLYRQP